MWHTYQHLDLDLRVCVHDDGRAVIEFGDDLDISDIPVDGEVLRAGGRLYMVGLMDTADPPKLYSVGQVPDLGLWWDADES